MIKNIFIGIFCFLLVFLMIFMLAEAYEKEECGRIFSQLQDKQKDPSLYPGFHLTPHIKSMCPEIEHQLQ